jgi:hypothetical protein
MLAPNFLGLRGGIKMANMWVFAIASVSVLVILLLLGLNDRGESEDIESGLSGSRVAEVGNDIATAALAAICLLAIGVAQMMWGENHSDRFIQGMGFILSMAGTVITVLWFRLVGKRKKYIAVLAGTDKS